jgi:hypothetical protein
MTRGTIKIAEVHESVFNPACWNENTTRTEAAITRTAPRRSSSFSNRRGAWLNFVGGGHDMIKITRGIIPMGALTCQSVSYISESRKLT